MKTTASSRIFWTCVALIVVAVVLAYANSFKGQLVLDDAGSIRINPTIRSLAHSFLPPPGGATVSGRPLLNVSFALNYAVGGESLSGYHAVNLLIHLLAALTLFGLVRRTLRTPLLEDRYGPDADWLALAIALLWALHPLQTESVTYLVQRAESLAGLFYLLTLYCFVRGTQPGASPRWFDASITACLLGAFTKETIVTAPLLVLLYDRIFVSKSFSEASDRHRSLYYGFALSWLVLCWSIVGTGGRGGTAGLDTAMGWRDYGLKQLEAITHYLQLVFWPHPLVLDYGMSVAVTPAQIAIGAAIVGGLVFGTALALRRWPALGFLGAWFILVLAPTSSVLPVASQTMAEHRMYLPLAAVVALVVFGLHRLLGRPAAWVCLVLAGICGALTVQRNRDYAAPVVLWTQVVACADSPRARLNLGFALADAGRPADAIEQYAMAIKTYPDNAEAHNNWANALVELGRLEEACPHYEKALRVRRNYVEAHYNFGNTLLRLGRYDEAVIQYESALKLSPDHALLHYNLGNAFVQLLRFPEAMDQFQEAVRLAPGHADSHFNFGCALLRAGRRDEAAGQFEAVLRLDPQRADAAHNLALARQAAKAGHP